MNAVLRGTFVISWEQTEVDGIAAAPIAAISRGAVWRWSGAVQCIDGPGGVLTPQRISEREACRARAARAVRRFWRPAGSSDLRRACPPDTEDRHPDPGFTVTDGRYSYSVSILDGAAGNWLAIFRGAMPPSDTDLFVVDHSVEIGQPGGASVGPTAVRPGGLICGTLIATPNGARPVEDIRQGEQILTKDDGPQDVIWTAGYRMTGVRLQAMPWLRPVRIRARALGADDAVADLVVAAGHRVLVKHAGVLALFNVPEVLVAAADLRNGQTISGEFPPRTVSFFHLMTRRHQIIWANGLAVESYWPVGPDPEMIAPPARAALLSCVPALASDPSAYGDLARRCLSDAETAIWGGSRLMTCGPAPNWV